MNFPLFEVGLLLVIIGVLYAIVYGVFLPIIGHFIAKTPNKYDDILLEKKVIARSLLLIPAVVFSTAVEYIFTEGSNFYTTGIRIANVWLTLLAYMILCSVIGVIEEICNKNSYMQNKPLHGIFQALKLLLFCVIGIIIISVITEKSPVIILSALGAMATVLMLIFRDSILGVVSGIQINISDLLRKGDWIEIERHQADGEVIDITLTSVKIRNWDKTISVIPAYDLITNSFKNWRGMEESGGRRIKRSLYIDQKTIRFLTEKEFETLSKIELLAPYLQAKKEEIKRDTEAHAQKIDNDEILNSRHLTNIGTFRAYCHAYLKQAQTISQKMTLMVRQLSPTPEGLPLEIYAFANTTDWIPYEGIQSDIFDHLIAALPEFGLDLYQYGMVVKK